MRRWGQENTYSGVLEGVKGFDWERGKGLGLTAPKANTLVKMLSYHVYTKIEIYCPFFKTI